ncbi:large-conductance mechanosensitive channel protein MscL [uncultured Jannaschia sp.]|uniref:large-conductance mechanosensitive channel protein MscL n=1 Tax=uncultured Jannaschia sp. TaxID=293347 RepID=UPI00260BBEF7|nr:large-conductance mechanosensitive channel protein MscL [uncultured Jannaschia sp.]
MIQEFKDFIAKGNVMDLAVGIIIGAAFTAIVTSLVEDLINPLIGLFVGGLDFSNLSFGVGEAQFMYGNFITAVINFLIVAFVVFLLVKAVNRLRSVAERPDDVAPDVPTGPSELDVLIDIRDQLAARPAPPRGPADPA